jgi:protein SMG6
LSITREPEKERRRGITRDWYDQGLADTPGNGKLHHHLGLFSREKDGEELRAVCHFVKRQVFTAMEKFLLKWTVV